MGRVKAEIDRIDSLHGTAMGVLLKSKAVSQCLVHDGIFIDNGDSNAVSKAYAIGTNMVKADQVDGTRAEFMEAIDSAYRDAGDECPICAKHRDE